MEHFSSSTTVEIKNFRVKEIRIAIAILVRPRSFPQLNDLVQGYITTVWSDYKMLICSFTADDDGVDDLVITITQW